MTRVAINGLGRIGRLALRRILQAHPSLEVAAVNDLAGGETLAYLLRRDSVHGIFNGISWDGKMLHAAGRGITVSSYAEPFRCAWDKLGIDIVLECTGQFADSELVRSHSMGDVRAVVISAPSGIADMTLIYGVNEGDYDPVRHKVVSIASCTSNCLIPVLLMLSRWAALMRVSLISINAYTSNQRLVDAAHRDLRRGRSGSMNVIPTASSTRDLVKRFFPALDGGGYDSLAYRVPVLCGSVCHITADLVDAISEAELRDCFRSADGQIVGYSEEELVSSDVIGDPHSALIDGKLLGAWGRRIRVVAWYDNEWAYACRLADMAEHIGGGSRGVA